MLQKTKQQLNHYEHVEKVGLLETIERNLEEMRELKDSKFQVDKKVEEAKGKHHELEGTITDLRL